MEAWIDHLITLLALPRFGLSTVFIVSFVSATLLPVGSEPAVFGLVKINPSLFWPAIGIATIGNTLGGAVSWGMGYGAHQLVDRYRHSPSHLRALRWLERLGPRWWETLFAQSPAGCGWRSGLASFTWPSASSCVIW
jgi:membrane protein YqaA with SNARE-associated domain